MQDLEGTSHSSELLYTFPSNMHSLHFSQQAPVCLMTRAQSLGRAGHFSLVHLTSLFRHRHEMQGLSVMSGISIAAPSSSQPATEPVNREGVTASWDSRTKERQSKRRPRTRRQRAPGSSIVTGCQSVSPVRARVAALGIPRSGVGRGCRRPQAGGRRKASHRRDSELFIPRLSSLPRTRALTIRAVHKQRPLQ